MNQPKKKFDRSLGTSKREQGVTTPKDMNRQKHKEGVKHAWKRRLEMSGFNNRPKLVYDKKADKAAEEVKPAPKPRRKTSARVAKSLAAKPEKHAV